MNEDGDVDTNAEAMQKGVDDDCSEADVSQIRLAKRKRRQTVSTNAAELKPGIPQISSAYVDGHEYMQNDAPAALPIAFASEKRADADVPALSDAE